VRVSDTDSASTLRRVLVLVVCVAVLGGAFAVLVAADGALRWLAGVVAAAAALATLAAAVRLFASLSLRLEPGDKR
jgi:hypothetical protein